MPGIVGYNFYIDGVKANDTLVTGDTFTFTGLLSNSDYSITATAVDAAGNESPQSAAFPFSTQSVSNENSPLSDADKAAVDAIVAESMASPQGGSPGYLIDLHGPRGYYTKAYGNTYGTNRPLTTDDHFRMGSNTKMFVALAALMQIDQGNLSFDDTVDQYVPGVTNGNLITIRNMFEMRAGLPDPLGDLGIQIRYWLLPTGNVPEQTMIDLSKAATGTPDTTFAYSNGSAFLMGAVLESITGRNIRDILIEDVITPLGLVDTTWPLESTIPLPSAGNYAMSMSLAGCAGALNTNLADLTNFAREIRDGTLLSREMHLDWINPTKGGPVYTGYELGTLPQPPSTFGYGYFLFSYGHWVGHGGSITGVVSPFGYDGSGGFNSACLANPDNGATIVVAENKQSATAQAFYYVANHIAAYLYPGSMNQRTFGGQTAFPVSASVSITGGTPVVSVDNPNKVITPTGAVLHVLGGTPGASPSLVLPSEASLAVTGGTPTVTVAEVTFTPFSEENVNRVDRPTPDGCTGCWATLIGAGGGGGGGERVSSSPPGAAGGGGGGRIQRVFIPVASLGSTYSVTRGLGGAGGLNTVVTTLGPGSDGGASTFSSGGVSLSAGGGGGSAGGVGVAGAQAVGAGGTCSASGVTVTSNNGTSGGIGGNSSDGAAPAAPDNPNGAAAGGGGGGYAPTTTIGSGIQGGDSATVTGGAGAISTTTNAVTPTSAAAGNGGAGGGGGAKQGIGANKNGAAGGLYGGGGGGGGSRSASTGTGGIGGDGADGYTLIEWV